MTFEREIAGHVDRLVINWIETGWEIQELWDRTVVRVMLAPHWRRVEALIYEFQSDATRSSRRNNGADDPA